uniref:Pecanex-like protein n=1 Tax=Schistosoma curassoni TaxID=6186 RepID=A0A183KKG3_9TREM
LFLNHQVDRISPSLVSSPTSCVPASSPSGFLNKNQSGVPSPMASISVSPNSSTSGLPLHNLPLNSSSTCTNVQNRLRSTIAVNNNNSNNSNNGNDGNNNQNIAATHRSHPNQLPYPHHQHSHQVNEQLQTSGGIQHQRQHSQGLPVQSQPTSQSLVTHFRSCSQPVSMSSGRDCGSNTGVILSSNSSGVSTATTTVTGTLGQTQLRIPGSLGGILSSSSSLTGLCGSNVNTGQQGCVTGSISTSSGQLVQGLECLRLNASVTSTSALNNSNHVLLDQQQIPKTQRVQQPQFILSANSGIVYGSNINTAAARLVGTVLPTTPQPGNQHSHQSSMDSGVGQSLTGQSNPSANQTPEHTVMLFCDPSKSD